MGAAECLRSWRVPRLAFEHLQLSIKSIRGCGVRACILLRFKEQDVDLVQTATVAAGPVPFGKCSLQQEPAM